MIIQEYKIVPGEETTFELLVARLPTRTEIKIPVTIYDSGIKGPSLLLMAGLHGDETNGIEIIRRILVNNHNIVKKGKVIAIPILNIFGFIHFSRAVPDGKDVNRSFPGSKNGSLASKVANLFMEEIMPHIDYGVDFHTGGNQIDNYPQIRGVFSNKMNEELAGYFQAPLNINSGLIEKSLRWAASKKKKPILVYEGGESLRFDEHVIQEGINGTLRLMKGLGMISKAPKQKEEVLFVKKRTWLRSGDSGLWVSDIKPGVQVKKGDSLGCITGPYGDFEVNIYAPNDGVIISINQISVVNRGDALIHLGYL